MHKPNVEVRIRFFEVVMMVALFVLTYWLALYWLLPSVGTVAAGIKAPIAV